MELEIWEMKKPTVYMLESERITFGLAKSGQTSIGGYQIFWTEHPRLFINERIDDAPFALHENSAVGKYRSDNVIPVSDIPLK